MCVKWLVANNAFVIMLGDKPIDIDGKTFFQSREELKDYLHVKGLDLKKNSVVLRSNVNERGASQCNANVGTKDFMAASK